MPSTSTPVSTETSTAAATAASTATSTPTATTSPLQTPADTYTATPTGTRSATPTQTLTTPPTGVPSPTSTETPTLTSQPTATATPTVSPADVTFLIGSAIGSGGGTTTIDVVLQTAVEVMETQNDIVLGPEIQIGIDDLGRPRCAVNPDINKDQTSFALRCDESAVCTLRVHVRAIDDVNPIPNGSTLYTCEIDIAPDAAPGTYTLACATLGASDQGGNALSTACVDGSVDVDGLTAASPTPTATPLPPTPTVTAQVTPITTRSPRPHHDNDDGCNVTASAGTHGAWLLALPVALLWLRRQRLSSKTRRRRPDGTAPHRYAASVRRNEVCDGTA